MGISSGGLDLWTYVLLTKVYNTYYAYIPKHSNKYKKSFVALFFYLFYFYLSNREDYGQNNESKNEKNFTFFQKK